jgi:hypothetical protein
MAPPRQKPVAPPKEDSNTAQRLAEWTPDWRPEIRAVDYRGKTYYVRELEAEDTAAWLKLLRLPPAERVRRTIAFALCGPAGEPLHPDPFTGPAPRVAFLLADRVLAAFYDINGLTDKAMGATTKK